MSWGTLVRLAVLSALISVSGLRDAGAEKTATLTDVRLGKHKSFTRLVLELDRKVTYEVTAVDERHLRISLPPLRPGALRRHDRALGLVSGLELEPSEHSPALAIQTRKPAKIRRHFILPPRAGKGARIVIDLSASKPAGPIKRPAGLIQLPLPHTDIARPMPARKQAAKPEGKPNSTVTVSVSARTKQTAKTKPRPVEIASAGGFVMTFEGDDAGAPRPEEGTPATEIAQAGISVNDWLRREQANPNVTPGGAGAYSRPAPRPSAAPVPAPAPAQPVYTAPITPNYVPPPPPRRQPASAWQPAATSAYPGAQPQRRPVRPRQASSQPQTSGADAVFTERTLSPLYFGGGFGVSNFEVSTSSTSGRDDDSSFYVKGFGGVRLNKYVAGELGLARVGSVEINAGPGNSVDETTYAATATGIFSLPLWDFIQPFARGGFHVWYKDQDTVSDRANGETSGADFLIGLGADFSFADEFLLRTEWERYFIDTDEADVFSASMIVNF